jgi:hypothetical protein
MKTLTFRARRNLVVLAVGSAPLAAAEWEEYVKTLQRVGKTSAPRVLVWSQGGGPDNTQRKRLTQIVEGGEKRVAAVLTDSGIVLAITTAISRFLPNTRAFRPTDLEAAFDHLGASVEDRTWFQETLGELKAELSPGTASAQTA